MNMTFRLSFYLMPIKRIIYYFYKHSDKYIFYRTRFIVTVAIIVYKDSIPVVYRILTSFCSGLLTFMLNQRIPQIFTLILDSLQLSLKKQIKNPLNTLILSGFQSEPKAGLEPATYSLRMSYSTN